MDIHLNAWGVKTKLDGTDNISIQFREADSKGKVIGHISRATAMVLMKDLGDLLADKLDGEKGAVPKVFVKALVAPGVHVCQIVNENKGVMELWLETAEGSRQTRMMPAGTSIYL